MEKNISRLVVSVISLVSVVFASSGAYAASIHQIQPRHIGTPDKPYRDRNAGPAIFFIQLNGHTYLLDQDKVGLIKEEWKISTGFPKTTRGYEKYTNFKKFHVIIFTLDGKQYPKILDSLKGGYRIVS